MSHDLPSITIRGIRVSQTTIRIDKDAIRANNVLYADYFMHSVDVDPELSRMMRTLATDCTLDSHGRIDPMKLAIVLPRVLNVRVVLVAPQTPGRTVREVGDLVVLAGHLGVLDGAWRSYALHQHFGGQLFHPCKAAKL